MFSIVVEIVDNEDKIKGVKGIVSKGISQRTKGVSVNEKKHKT